MNAAEHKAKAEELLADLAEAGEKLDGELLDAASAQAFGALIDRQLALAQVHATLATIPEPVEALLTREEMDDFRNRDVSWWQCRYCGQGSVKPLRTLKAEAAECLAHEASCPERES
ncbi:hypothetical protein [Kineosporia babensis]|uniref:Uncharacterized protein n=1 Tax=Kineosporia babensis TaxID=499548 RepID=A0A9X1SYC4_9ACTN|nr:hypothetical protein [Kineosporia babensis]MCD5310873.1 hypothetical protein [Kineosporia babensis]